MGAMTFSLPDPARPMTADIQDVIVPRARDLGEMTVKRALPSRQRQMVGPFIFFDQMGPARFGPDEGINVRPHPHIGLATVTYLFDGRIRHRDSLGNTQDITPGSVNWMIAGRGISHSERAPEDLRGQAKTAFGIQTWVALPQAHEDAAPDFPHVGEDVLPTLDDGGVFARVILGRAYGAEAPVRVFSDTLYVHADLAGGATIPLPDDHEDRAVYVAAGSVMVGGAVHEAGRLIVFGDGPAAVTAGEGGARLMLVGGEVADGPRHIWWNFVASTKERIEEAKRAWAAGDWQDGRFSLPPGDDEEFIPLPGGAPMTEATFVP